jgi:Tol biopolymer transport system component
VTTHCTSFGWPSWSPDGKTIDYVGAESAGSDEGPMSVQSDIWSIPLTAGGHVNVTSTATIYENRPDWSPDGSKIAIDSSPPFSASQIWVMDPNGANRVKLTSDPVSASGAAWSPDQSRITFDSYRDGNYEIYVMNVDGSGQANLTRNGASDFEADWQPTEGPQRGGYKNDAQFCKAEHDFLGGAAFRQKYGGGAGAYGKCVSGK